MHQGGISQAGKKRRRLLDPTPLKVQAALGLIDDEEESTAVLIEAAQRISRPTRLAGQLLTG